MSLLAAPAKPLEHRSGRDTDQALRGRQFAELQEYLQTVAHAVVDAGASNVEKWMTRMRRYRGSQEDFDGFVVPTVPALKQQQDTIATLMELFQLGVPPERLKLVFNMVADDQAMDQAFDTLLAFLAENPVASPNLACRIGANEIYARVKASAADLNALAGDTTDYKGLIAQASHTAQKLALSQQLANQRLACGVVPELDACFAAPKLSALTVETARPAPW